MKTLIDYYDDFAEKWAETWYANEMLLPYLKEFVSLLPSNAKVLDLCCGAGYESMRLSKLGVNVVGADLSENSIQLAKKYNPQLNFYVKDMLKSYADLGVFDGVACIAGVVHLPEEKLELAFKNMHEVVVDGGYLLLVLRNGNQITKSIDVDGIQYAREFYCYTLDKINEKIGNYFNLFKELHSADDWRYYIFKKK